MNTSKNKILLFLVGILLVTNIALVVFFVNKGKPEDKQHGNSGNRTNRSAMMRNYLKDTLGFNDQQLGQFDRMREQHDENIKPLFEELRQAKVTFYTMLKDSATADSVSNAAAVNIGEKQKQVDLAFYNHFRDVRALCTPAQQAGYDSLIQQIIRRMVSAPRRGGEKGEQKQQRQR